MAHGIRSSAATSATHDTKGLLIMQENFLGWFWIKVVRLGGAEFDYAVHEIVHVGGAWVVEGKAVREKLEVDAADRGG